MQSTLQSVEVSRRGDSNSRPAVYETAALPLSYVGEDGEFSSDAGKENRSELRVVGRPQLAGSGTSSATSNDAPTWFECSSASGMRSDWTALVKLIPAGPASTTIVSPSA